MNEKQSLWSATLNGTFWVYLTTYSGKIVVFISTIVLARVLLKEDFGVAGYALAVMGFLNVFNDFGLRTAIIYFPESKNVKEIAFTFNLLIGIALFGLTWLLAPYIGAFFGDDRAVLVTRVLALTLPILALGNTHDALLRKQMKFDVKALPDTVKVVSKGIISIGLAVQGFGYWSLIFGQIAGSILWVLALWWLVPWRPTFVFNMREFGPLFRYSLNIVTTSTLAVFFTNADYLLIGRYMGAVELGIYTLAFRLPELLIQEFPTTIGNVLFPAFSKIGSDNEAIQTKTLLSIRYSALITLPVGLGLALTAQPLILLFYSAKWIDSIPVMSLIAIQMTLVSLVFNFGMVYKVQGRPFIHTCLVFTRMVILIPALWWAASQYGTVTAVAVVHVIVGGLIVIMDIIAAVTILKMQFTSIVEALSPAATASLGLVAAVLGVNYLMQDSSPLLHLFTAFTVGGLVYIGSLFWFQRDTVTIIETRLRSSLPKSLSEKWL